MSPTFPEFLTTTFIIRHWPSALFDGHRGRGVPHEIVDRRAKGTRL